MMRRLPVDLEELALAFEESSGEVQWYLDRDTGEIIAVTLETWSLLDEIEADSDVDTTTALSTLLAGRDLPDWLKEAILDAGRVRDGYPERFVEVPQAETRETYADMEAFIATVPSVRLRHRLEDAIVGRGAFRRFRDLLDGDEAEERRWYSFKTARLRERTTAWLAAEGIRPVARERS
jgi:hypothetical protein